MCFPLRVWSYWCFFRCRCVCVLCVSGAKLHWYFYKHTKTIQKKQPHTKIINAKRKDGGESRKKVSNKKSFISSSKEEKKEKRGKQDSEEGGRVAGKQGSRRATSLLNLFTSSSSSSPNAQGRFLSLTLYSLSQSFSICSFEKFSNKKKHKKNWLTHVPPFSWALAAPINRNLIVYTLARLAPMHYIYSFFHFVLALLLYSFPLFFHNCPEEKKNRSFRSLFEFRKG